jgi:hypothetical protein
MGYTSSPSLRRIRDTATHSRFPGVRAPCTGLSEPASSGVPEDRCLAVNAREGFRRSVGEIRAAAASPVVLYWFGRLRAEILSGGGAVE